MRFFFTLIILSILLVSCTAAPTAVKIEPNNAPTIDNSTTPVANPTAVQNLAYPITAATNLPGTAYPAGQQQTIVDTPKPEPTFTTNPKMGIVKGIIQKQGKPVGNLDLYIANLIKNAQGQDTAFSFSQSDSPRTTTNDQGAFEFVNVPTGTHALILDMVVQSYLLLKPNAQESIRFDVKEGNIIDLGVLNYDDLPVPSSSK